MNLSDPRCRRARPSGTGSRGAGWHRGTRSRAVGQPVFPTGTRTRRWPTTCGWRRVARSPRSSRGTEMSLGNGGCFEWRLRAVTATPGAARVGRRGRASVRPMNCSLPVMGGCACVDDGLVVRTGLANSDGGSGDAPRLAGPAPWCRARGCPRRGRRVGGRSSGVGSAGTALSDGGSGAGPTHRGARAGLFLAGGGRGRVAPCGGGGEEPAVVCLSRDAEAGVGRTLANSGDG